MERNFVWKETGDMVQNNIQFFGWQALLEPRENGGKPRLFISFSGGKTSGVMTRLCLQHLSDTFEIVVGFANTGEENEQTLEFIHNCDTHFGFNTVWLEAVVSSEHGEGTTHRIVDYETASRHGEPFEAVIQKYGIPNKSHPHCTRELKQRALDSYLRSIGWTDYYTAIGIRPDEGRRVNAKAAERSIVYPLIDWFYMDKQDVNAWWEEQPFNLELSEHNGNCKTCWKKSDAKLFLIWHERPDVFRFNDRMEKAYARVGAEFVKDPTRENRVFFRGNRSTPDLIAAAKVVAQPVKALQMLVSQGVDADGGCSESCEMYPMLDFSQ